MDTTFPAPVPPWRLPTRVAFRFFAIYFFMYVLMTQMLGELLPFLSSNMSNMIGKALDPFILWTGDKVFHVVAKPVVSGSGDKMYDWMQAFCLLVTALTATVVWSILDRRRERYDRLYRWFRVFLRFALGSTMIEYGFSKAFPLQMPAPGLTRLLEPFGNFSPMGVLWSSIGASFPYERFVGIVEVMGGALLFFPRTQLAGALVMLGAAFEVFMLNMTYDVPVKLFSFHLVVMSVVLIAPYAKSLCAVVFAPRGKSWWAEGLQIVAGVCLIWTTAHGVMQGIGTYGYMVPKPPLYGIWTVEKMKIDGVERSPLITDYDRWRRVIVQNAQAMQFWRMDDTVMGLSKKLDEATHTIMLTRGKDSVGSLTYQQVAGDQLIFDGTIDKHAIHMETRLLDHNKMLLKTRGFNWVQEYPFNR